MADKLKICHIITRMIVGGAQENTLLTIIGHVLKGHEVTLITGPSPGPEGELLKRCDFPEFEILENPFLVRSISPFHDLMAYFTLLKFLRKREFDVVHTHSSKAGIIGRAAAWNANIPFVAHTIHGQAFHPYEKPWKNFIYKMAERWAAKRCHKIYAVAQAMIDQCIDAKIASSDKYKVVYSGMELENYLSSKADPELMKKFNITEKNKVIGAIARLFPLKGYEYFIPAAALIAEKYPEARFLVVGDGIMKDDIIAKIKELGIADKFIFTGLVPPSDIYRYTALMDVLIHLSLREGLPRTVVQAMASGKPAIGFDLDGTPEAIINGITGFITRPEDIKAVFEAASKIISDESLARKLGDAARKHVMEKWDWKKMTDILEKEYISHSGKAE